MSAAWISHCLDQAKDRDALLFNELGANPEVLTFKQPGTFFSHSLAGGLGWGLPAALGAKLACPERLVIAAVGDGSYMFANPVACHQVSEALELPVLTIVFNNGVWNAVRKSTQAVYPDGHAVRANRMPLTSLEPAPRYEMIVAASGGYGERVETASELPAALERALARRQARQAPGAPERHLPVSALRRPALLHHPQPGRQYLPARGVRISASPRSRQYRVPGWAVRRYRHRPLRVRRPSWMHGFPCRLSLVRAACPDAIAA